jgi:hypothetical protein
LIFNELKIPHEIDSNNKAGFRPLFKAGVSAELR